MTKFSKYLVTYIISLYQAVISPVFKQFFGVASFCRFTPTCSEYAKNAITKHGLIKGGVFSARRIASCNPFNKNISQGVLA